MRKLTRYFLPLMLVGVLAVACDDDDNGTTGPNISDLAGTWNLVDPSTLDPAAPGIPTLDLDAITTTTLVIQNNGDFTLTITQLGAPAPVVITGEFEITGSNSANIINDADPNDPLAATFSLSNNDDTLSVQVDGAELIDITQDGQVTAADAGDLNLTFDRQ